MVQSLDLARISTVQSIDFLGQSSDLAEDLLKSSSGSEEFILFVWVSVWHLDSCLLHNLWIVPLSLQIVFHWKLDFHEHGSDSDHRSVCCGSLLFNFYSIHHFIMKSSVVCSEILGFPSKSLDKSSDCVDFTKSMDLSDLSEYIEISPNFNFQFLLLIRFITILILNLVFFWILSWSWC